MTYRIVLMSISLHFVYSRYDDDEGDKIEGDIPGGLFTGHYDMEIPEGN